uniref:Uncharacterized protein n=1 Tax=Aegilops tauschii subsp. strangulata TaxID=200361 RepID=A0A453T105_AEGTS
MLNYTLEDDKVHELPLCKSQPPFVWSAISSVCTVEQPPACFLPYLLQIVPQQLMAMEDRQVQCTSTDCIQKQEL